MKAALMLLRSAGGGAVADAGKELIGLLSAPQIEHVLDLKLEISRNPYFLDIFNAVMHWWRI